MTVAASILAAVLICSCILGVLHVCLWWDYGLIAYAWKALTGTWVGKHVWNKPAYPVRWFYRIKAAMCLLLNREPSKRDEYDLWTYSVRVTITDSGVQPGTVHGPAVYWHEAILVGQGLFREWWACVAQASSE